MVSHLPGVEGVTGASSQGRAPRLFKSLILPFDLPLRISVGQGISSPRQDIAIPLAQYDEIVVRDKPEQDPRLRTATVLPALYFLVLAVANHRRGPTYPFAAIHRERSGVFPLTCYRGD